MNPKGTRPLPWWVRLLLAYLAGITIIGKGPTYIGIPPFFWGEITLGFSLLLIAPWALRSGFLGRNRALVIVISAFMILGAIETAANYGKWGLDALRDAAIWYYGLFFFVGLGLASREAIASRVWRWLCVFWMISLAWNTADLLSSQRLSQLGPVIPWRGVPLLFNSVHEAGQNLALGALIVLCTTALRGKPIWRAILTPTACVGLGAFAIAHGRGMRVGIASGIAVALLLALPRRKLHFSTRLVTVSVAAVPVLLLASTIYAGKVTKIAHLDRFEEADPYEPVGTANWRVVWWEYLYDGVMRTNPAFGLGFGESLHLYHPLLRHVQEVFIVRSPHNFNVTVFARMGIVGFTLWVAILILGIGGLFRRAWRGTVRGSPYAPERRDELAFWVVMLVATVVNASFGVLMEGPVLGIWFWFALGFANGRAMTTGAFVAPLERLRKAVRRIPSEAPREMALP